MGAVGLRLAVESGESLQRSGAGLLLSILLTLSNGLSRFGDESLEESVRLAAVPVTPGLIPDKAENCRLKLLLSELGQFNLRVGCGDRHPAVGAEIEVTATALEAMRCELLHCCFPMWLSRFGKWFGGFAATSPLA